jgi:hypothetical protein
VALCVELPTIMSSTYINTNIVTPPLLKRNNDLCALEGTKPRFCNLELI